MGFWDNAAAQQDTPAKSSPSQKVYSVSGNPAGTDFSVVGTGELGRAIGLKDEWGIKFGGVYIADTNLVAGGPRPGAWTNNSAVIVGLGIDANKLVDWKGASFGFQFLQFNGSDPDTNATAGSVMGFNGIVGAPPYNRTELLEAWYLQEMIPDKLKMRVGRTLPTYDFGNVLRPVTLDDDAQNIPVVTGLLYSPVFLNASMITAFMGYYNPADGVTVNFTPNKSFYVNAGVYGGDRYRGLQTGINPPMFNGYWFNIGEIGTNWLLGEGRHPGQFGIGLWRQTGQVGNAAGSEDGTGGFYLYGSQRVAYRVNPDVPNSSISIFYQYGANQSKVMPMTQYYGAGISGFGLIGSRARDSMGLGVAVARLQPNLFERTHEVMIQAYYQAHLFAATYLQPTVTYIPVPGVPADAPGALAMTMRLTVLF
jgi:porin